ncbi:MAG TPA: serine hydrolase domain-containing protein [Acidimicrobiales bacterium]|nr:serine hydrolase domain-containing protein [Acidimicrobiales bacterium]
MNIKAPASLEPLREKVANALVKQGLPSLAVAVAREGEVIWAEGFGWADRAKRVPADAHTPYSLASISKPVTAVGLMRLVQQGKVELDAPVEQYLDGRLNARAGVADEATVRRVAEHTAGLPLHYHFFYEDEPFTRPHMAETMRRYATLVSAPGERMNYSNLGYGILDHLIARVSGVSYAEFLRQEVFNPLGMTRSSVDPDPALADVTATRYGADGVPYPFYDFDHPGGSAVYSSAYDLVRFAMANLGTLMADQREVLDARTIEEMHRPSPLAKDGHGYGIGWGTVEDEGGYQTRGHTGGMGGVATVMTLVPSEQVAVVALCNAGGLLPHWARLEMLAALLPKYAEQKDKVMAALMQQAMPPAQAPRPDVVSELVGKWEGVVETHEESLPVTIEFAADGGATARLGTQLRTLVDEIRWDGERFAGKMHGDLRTEDARRRPGHVALDLRLRGDVIDGAATAMTDYPEGEGGAPGRRVGNALSHWIRLERATG